MERKIGEIFEYNGEWYQCVEGTNCRECDFSSNNVTCDIHGAFKCTCKGRSDETSVVFKKLEKVGEPYMTGNKLIQRYKIYPTTYCISVYGWYYQNLGIIKSWTIDIEKKGRREMRAINTMQKEEYAERLSEAMRRMSKKIYRLMDEEDSLSTKADNQGDEEKALLHAFNSRALLWASEAIAIAPGKLQQRITEINRHEFVPTLNAGKVMLQNPYSMYYYYCERCGRPVEKPEPFNPKVIPLMVINGKFYCPDCYEYDEETNEYKPKVKEK